MHKVMHHCSGVLDDIYCAPVVLCFTDAVMLNIMLALSLFSIALATNRSSWRYT